MERKKQGRWSDAIPPLGDSISSCPPHKFLDTISRLWPGVAERYFADFAGIIKDEPKVLQEAVEYAIKNARLNGRAQADLTDLYFGLLSQFPDKWKKE